MIGKTLKIFAIALFGSIFLFTSVLLRPSVAFGEGGAAGLVNINTADVVELDTLPGIGAVKAQAIVDYRTQNGLFIKIEDIMNVSGIGQVTFDNMKSFITVGDNEQLATNNEQTTNNNVQVITNNEQTETVKETLGYEVGSVVINELVSDPADGGVEFVELYNTTIYSVDLSGWRIEDGSGGKNILDYNLPANGFFVVEKPKGNLNNAGDIIKLFDAANGLIDQAVYGDWDDGNKTDNAPRADDPLSLARRFDGEDTGNDINDFLLTENITKGGSNIILRKGIMQSDAAPKINSDFASSTTVENIISAKGAMPTGQAGSDWKTVSDEIVFASATVKISDKNKTNKSKMLIASSLENLRNKNIGSRVKILGSVIVLPNIFGTQYFYIANDTGGVQIYMNKKDFPDFAVGDEVEVIGEISEAYGETRVKVAIKGDIRKTGKHTEISPQQIEIADIEESLEGSFVQLKGEITELKTSYMFIDDGTDELKVYFKKGAKIQSKNFGVGDMVEVKGLLGESRSGYQLLPRSTDDIKKINDTEMLALQSLDETAVKQKEITEKYLTVTAGGLTSILIGLFAKARGAVFLAFTKRIGKIAWAFVKRG